MVPRPCRDPTSRLAWSLAGQLSVQRSAVLRPRDHHGSGASYGDPRHVRHKIGNDYFSGNDTQIPASYNVRDADLALSFDLSSDSTLDFEYLRRPDRHEYAGLMFDARFRKTDAFFARYRDTDWLSGELSADGWYNHTQIAGDNQNLSKQCSTAIISSSPPAADLFSADRFPWGVRGRRQQCRVSRLAHVGTRQRRSPDRGGRFSLRPAGAERVDNLTNRDLLFTPSGYENFPIPQSNLIDPGCSRSWNCRAQRSEIHGRRAGGLDSDRCRSFYRAQDPDGSPDDLCARRPARHATRRDLFRTGLTKNDVLFSGFLTAEQQLDEQRELRWVSATDSVPVADGAVRVCPVSHRSAKRQNAPLATGLKARAGVAVRCRAHGRLRRRALPGRSLCHTGG